MTINEATIDLFNWYFENQTFSEVRDLKEFFDLNNKKKKNKEEINDDNIAAIRLGLDKLIEAGIIKKTNVANADIYVLVKNLEKLEQTITISAELCYSIAELISQYGKLLNSKESQADPLHIQEKDITTLVVLSDLFLAELKSKDGKVENMFNDADNFSNN